MREFLPLFFGIVVGVLAGPRPGAIRFKVALGLGVALGPISSWMNGELGDSAWLFVFDVAQVMAAFAVTVVVARRLPVRSAPRSEG